MEVAQGALLGLVIDERLEITNCFPFPKHSDENLDEGKKCKHNMNPTTYYFATFYEKQ